MLIKLVASFAAALDPSRGQHRRGINRVALQPLSCALTAHCATEERSMRRAFRSVVRVPVAQSSAQCVPTDAGNEPSCISASTPRRDDRPPCREEWRRQDWAAAVWTAARQRRSPYLNRDDEPSPAPDERGPLGVGPALTTARVLVRFRYQSLEREYDRLYAPPPPPEEDTTARTTPGIFLGELQSQNSDLHRELGNL
uniref:Uncharacterized protein n=1 Tax=Heliothis virescens TaxID=7102 RepID=A0A2A4K8G6_HELVI